MASAPVQIIDEPIADPVADPVVADPVVATDPVATDPVVAPVIEDKPVDDWRTRMATADGVVDDKLLGYLGRYQSETAAMAEFKKQRDAIASGKYIRPLGDNASEEELTAYRTMFGVPGAPEGYLEKLPDGLVVGDDDRPAVDKILTAMHGMNAPKPVVEAMLSTYYDIVDQQYADTQARNETAKTEGIEALTGEWGPDYKRNINAVKSYLGTLPEPVQEALMGATLPDGTSIGNNPAVIQFLAGLALEQNPLVTVVPGAGANQADAIADEIGQIEAKMGNRTSEYWKGDKDDAGQTKLQRRLLTLYDARDKIR